MMPDPTPRWSKADTHCVWCGKPVEHHTDYCEESAGTAATAIALTSLRDTVEAQGNVIERLRDGWIAVDPTGDQPVWRARLWSGPWPPKYEPMTPAEQWVLYGSVVNEEAGDG